MSQFSISIVLPIYNEEKNLQKGVLDKVLNYAQKNRVIVEVVVVDDGSNDESSQTIRQNYLGQYPKLKLIEKKHSGKAYSIIEGIKKSKGTHVLFSDIDLATPIEEADKLILSAKKGSNIVIGSRNSRRKDAPIIRQLMAVGFIYIRNFLIGLKGINDTQCGFKLFEKKAALTIINHLKVFNNEKTISGSSVSAGFDLEFLYLASKYSYKIKEIPVTWRHVETKNVNFVKDSVETLIDIARIKYNEISKKYPENV
jgi:glycosyltransferase involved in cell wall biosynthesis